MARVRMRVQIERRGQAGAFGRVSDGAAGSIKELVQRSGRRIHDMAAEFCAVDTGYMRAHLGLAFSADAGVYESEIGWDAETFAAGEHARHPGQPVPFYPPHVELGTRFMAAQPSLLPAFDAEVPIFRAELAALLERSGNVAP